MDIYLLWSSDPEATVDPQLISVCADKESADHAFWQNGENGYIEIRSVYKYKRRKQNDET